MATGRRSKRAKRYQSWYGSARWKRLRASQLKGEPNCRLCAERDTLTRATIVDHVVPHRGDSQLFWGPLNLQSLCRTCHDSVKQSAERGGDGLRRGCDEDGLPLSTQRGGGGSAFLESNGSGRRGAGASLIAPEKIGGEDSLFWPAINRAPAVPTTVVCGCPGSGREAYVKKRAKSSDLIISVERILAEMTGRRYSDDWIIRERALTVRNQQIRSLADERVAGAAWFITGAPAGSARENWARVLRALKVVVMLTPTERTLKRISAMNVTRQEREAMSLLVGKWWGSYFPSKSDTPVIA